jgi:hypothetical protein
MHGNNEVLKPKGKPICRCEYNFKMDVREIGYGVLTGCSGSGWALVNAVMNP